MSKILRSDGKPNGGSGRRGLYLGFGTSRTIGFGSGANLIGILGNFVEVSGGDFLDDGIGVEILADVSNGMLKETTNTNRVAINAAIDFCYESNEPISSLYID
ncbi:hypothetical protein FRX31_021252 [Thalictrum thalictroides]|uniref:Uncharacterized protein n=1 Tax=Thalictrum thalictroides TaxID=46969 RepID=A0A7J6VWD8_THATH|nr:hypothetical protein FRX31_021252 [Thalictrum thalictroides]